MFCAKDEKNSLLPLYGSTSRIIQYNLLDWIAGCALIYGSLFGVGKVILKDYITGAGFLAVALAAGLYIYRDLTLRGWKSVIE
jgi:hypothetical protein